MSTKQESAISKRLLMKSHAVTDIDRIVSYMISDETIELNEHEKTLFTRIEFAYDNLQEYSDKEVRNMLKRKFGVSQSTAYNDINTAYLIHGKTGKLKRDIEIYFLLQDARIAIRNAHESKNNNQLIKAIEAKAKVLQLIKDEEAVDWSKIQPNNFYLVINQAEGDQKRSLKIDLNKVHELKEDEMQLLQQQITDHYSDETIQILEQNGNSEAG